MIKHFTLTELNPASEAIMIGTITNVINNKQGLQLFKERFTEAVSDFFDTDDFDHDELPDLDLFSSVPYQDVMIEINGMDFEIRISETFLY